MEIKHVINVDKADSLLAQIKKHNELYRLGDPEISDLEYDAMVDMLRKLSPDNEWFNNLEPAVIGGGRKVKLPIPMKSLNKAKSVSEIVAWINSLSLGSSEKLIITPKFDGVSLLYGESMRFAYSRGGMENEGQDCTEHMSMINSNCKHDVKLWNYVFGEFVFSCKEWNSKFLGKISPETGDKYKSPRNTAAGMLNREAASPLIQYVDFFRYGIDTYSLNNFDTYQDIFTSLCEGYSQPKLMSVTTVGELNDEMLLQLFKDWSSSYYLDGLVIYINDLDIWDRIGRHKTTGNPLYAIAYKHPDFSGTFETTVNGISWKVSKSGALKPVVNIDVVDTGDCNMENPTGYNAGWIADHDIAKGAKVLVTRSGGVIPKILATTSAPLQVEVEHLWDSMSECPHCGSVTCWGDNHIELYCSNRNCDGVKLAKMVFFYLTCGAENVGEETLSKIFNSGYTSIKQLLNISFNELMSIDGFGESVSNTILDNNKKIMLGVDLTTLMHASDCFSGIGKIKAQKIIDTMSCNDVELLYGFRYVGRTPLHQDWDRLSKTSQSFELGLPKFYDVVRDLSIPILKPNKVSVNVHGKYAGFNVCFSGIRDASLEEKIIAGGGAILSGVSKKTTHLVVKDTLGVSSKITKAKELGVRVLSVDEFVAL